MDLLEIKSLRIPEGEMVKISVGGRVLWQVEAPTSSIPIVKQLTVPTISLDGDILTMTATDDRTEEFVIFVDGVETTTVENEKEETPDIPDIPDIPDTPETPTQYTVSGTWYFNETISASSLDVDVDFKNASGTTFIGISVGQGSMIFNTGKALNELAYYGSLGGWQNQDDRTITFDGVQTVSKEFYAWFVANAKRPISGAWKFNETLVSDWSISEYFAFTANNVEYVNIEMVGYKGGDRLYYDYDQDTKTLVYDGAWKNEAYRTIILDGMQYVSQGFYEWFTESAKQTGKHPEEA